MIRYLEGSHGSAAPNGQDGEDTKFNGQEEGPLETPIYRMSRAWRLQPTSQVPAFARYSSRTIEADRTSDTSEPPNGRATQDARHHHTQAKTSEEWRPPDDRPRPDDRQVLTRAETADARPAPNVRTLASLRTTGDRQASDACVTARVLGRSHLPFRPLRL